MREIKMEKEREKISVREDAACTVCRNKIGKMKAGPETSAGKKIT